MAKVKILLQAALLAVMPLSCDLFTDVNRGTPAEEDSFYAQNIDTGEYYEVKAELLYQGKKCMIWAEKSAKVTQQTAKNIADEYDGKIRSKIVEAFSMKKFTVSQGDVTYHFDNMLDYANRLAGRNDNKLTVLLLDIQDGFKDPATDSYVAGYFWGGNFFEKGNIEGTPYYSSGRDMIYIDTYPGLKMNPRQTYATFAHELQHLINFVTSVQMDRYLMDTWIDEGLSSQAEYLYLGQNSPDKCKWFAEDKKGTIAQGNNFFVWDNHDEEPMAILDDYATVYLFFRWLYLQAGKELQSHIFLDIETSSFDNYRAITAIARQINPAWGSWETLLGTWLAANYYPGNTVYGYKNDDYLQETITVKPVAEQTISLYPGEGVYSIINNAFSAEPSDNIRYAGLAKDKTTIGTSSPYTGDVLLTFNANASNYPAVEPETGYLTGVPPSASQTAARNIGTGTLTGPYVIDARDMLNKTKK